MIRVHIERLVLHGFDVGATGAERWRAAVERELAVVLQSHGAGPAGPVVLDSADPDRGGRLVARSVAAQVRPAVDGRPGR
jgi:hypothetical protein